MRVLVSGSSGLVGSELSRRLRAAGDTVTSLTRSGSSPEAISWSPRDQQLDSSQLEGFDAVVHLAGENIATGRWTADKKRRIRESRVQGTELLSRTLAELEAKPKVLVCASAIGYYGDRGDVILDEQSPPGTGFLAEVCQAWEAATEPAWKAGIRVAQLRIGVVLSPQGGALAKMLLPFRMGAGGVVGSGDQYMSWIALPDLARAIEHVIHNDSLFGAVNAVAPNPVTNREYTQTLGKVLHRPTLLPMPAFLAKIALGEMAEELFLSSTRVEPRKLDHANFTFDHPDLEGALRSLLATTD